MRTFYLTLLVLSIGIFSSCAQDINLKAQELVGTWKIDMSPQDKSDNNFAIMIIDKVAKNSIKGTFYRKGVKIREGRINTLTNHVYGALVSGDNSGDYNTSFYLKDGKLYGSTHSLKKDFLSVWEAVKEID